MRIAKSQFNTYHYQLWSAGFILPRPKYGQRFVVKFELGSQLTDSCITIEASSVSDVLERACFAITYSSPYRPEDVDLKAVFDEEGHLLWLEEEFLRVVQPKNEFRGMERREFLLRFGATSAAIVYGLSPLKALAGTTSVSLSGIASNFSAASGQQLYTTPGSYSFTVPANVFSVAVVCIGGGGGGSAYFGSAGGGGALVFGSFSVSPGQSCSVVVGSAGTGGPAGTTATGQLGGNGGNSSFSNGTSMVAGGGQGGNGYADAVRPAGGVPSGTFSTGTYGGVGGGPYSQGSTAGASTPYMGSGGGGAGGYGASGGDGGGSITGSNGTYGASTGGFSGGSGGGGGGNAASNSASDFNGNGGGGVGLYGQGANGAAGAAQINIGVAGFSGGGGSGGFPGGISSGPSAVGAGGAYGGGGSPSYGTGTMPGGPGGEGAVRIIWGSGRSFPNNAT